MKDFVSQYEDEKINNPAVAFFIFLIIGGFFSIAGTILEFINSGFEFESILKTLVVLAVLPGIFYILISRLKNYRNNIKSREEILTRGQKFPGEIRKIITKSDREYPQTFMKSTRFFEFGSHSYAVVRVERPENSLEIQTPPLNYLPNVGEPIDVYFLNGVYYVNNPRMQ